MRSLRSLQPNGPFRGALYAIAVSIVLWALAIGAVWLAVKR
jgi:hypothetical protein